MRRNASRVTSAPDAEARHVGAELADGREGRDPDDAQSHRIAGGLAAPPAVGQELHRHDVTDVGADGVERVGAHDDLVGARAGRPRRIVGVSSPLIAVAAMPGTARPSTRNDPEVNPVAASTSRRSPNACCSAASAWSPYGLSATRSASKP